MEMTHPKYFLSLSLALCCCFLFCFLFWLPAVIFNYIQDSIPDAKERTVNKLILIMCMNSRTTLYISHFYIFCQSVVLLEDPTLDDCIYWKT